MLCKLIRIHIRILLDLQKCESKANFVKYSLLLSGNKTKMHYIVIESIVRIYAIRFLREQLLEAFSAPIRPLIFLWGNHNVIGHNYISIRSNGIEMDAQLIEEIVYRLTGKHIADKKRTLLKFVAVVLKESDNTTGLGILIVDNHLVAVAYCLGGERKTTETCANYCYFHFASTSASADSGVDSAFFAARRSASWRITSA